MVGCKGMRRCKWHWATRLSDQMVGRNISCECDLSRSYVSLCGLILLAVMAGCGGSTYSAPKQPSSTGQITFSFGTEETVFSSATDSCVPEDLPDTPAHAVRLGDGSLLFEDGGATGKYMMYGADFSTLKKSCIPTMNSD